MSQGYPPQPPYGQQPNGNNPQQPNQPPSWQQPPQYPPGYQLPQPPHYPYPQPGQPPKKKRLTIKEQWNSGPAGKFAVIATIVLALLVCGACSGIANAISRGSQSTTTPQTSAQIAATDTPAPTDTPDPTTKPAYQLATIDTGTTPDNATVAKYQVLLDELHDKTGEPEQDIADETVKGQQILQESGMNATLFELMNGVNTAVTKNEHIKYTEALAALITLMQNQ